MTGTYVIIGMPGSGKSTIGRQLAFRLGLPFADSDREIEAAAGMAVPQIFETLGEPAFRDGERKVIARLLSGSPMVLSTGGGAFMNEETREIIKKYAISIWLKADFDVLIKRCLRKQNRPLFKKGDPATILAELQRVREPLYAQADITVLTDECPVDETIDKVIEAIQTYHRNKG